MMSVWCLFRYHSSIKEPKHMVQICVMLLLPRNWRQSSEEIPGECEGVPAAMCQKRDSWLDMNVAQSVSPARRKAASGHWGNYFQKILKLTPGCMIWEQESALNILDISNIMQRRPDQSTFHKLIFVGPQSTWGMTSDMLKNAHKIVRKLIGMYQVYGLVFNSTGFSEDKFLVCMCSLFPSCLLNVCEETNFFM